MSLHNTYTILDEIGGASVSRFGVGQNAVGLWVLFDADTCATSAAMQRGEKAEPIGVFPKREDAVMCATMIASNELGHWSAEYARVVDTFMCVSWAAKTFRDNNECEVASDE